MTTYRNGNGMRTIGYEADGEASDWMLTTFGIVAASPELGTKDKRTSDFLDLINSFRSELLMSL